MWVGFFFFLSTTEKPKQKKWERNKSWKSNCKKDSLARDSDTQCAKPKKKKKKRGLGNIRSVYVLGFSWDVLVIRLSFIMCCVFSDWSAFFKCSMYTRDQACAAKIMPGSASFLQQTRHAGRCTAAQRAQSTFGWILWLSISVLHKEIRWNLATLRNKTSTYLCLHRFGRNCVKYCQVLSVCSEPNLSSISLPGQAHEEMFLHPRLPMYTESRGWTVRPEFTWNKICRSSLKPNSVHWPLGRNRRRVGLNFNVKHGDDCFSYF